MVWRYGGWYLLLKFSVNPLDGFRENDVYGRMDRRQMDEGRPHHNSSFAVQYHKEAELISLNNSVTLYCHTTLSSQTSGQHCDNYLYHLISSDNAKTFPLDVPLNIPSVGIFVEQTPYTLQGDAT